MRGVIEDERTVQPNPWEQVRRTGESAIKSWIDNTMDKCSCVVVLIGELPIKESGYVMK